MLIPEWKRVLRRAWSMRLMLLAGILTGAEAVINAVGAEWLPVPPKWRAAVILLVIAGAFVARLTAQKGIRDEQ